jgi:lipoprotein-anchoring transpeptidase ErfK/SrfK
VRRWLLLVVPLVAVLFLFACSKKEAPALVAADAATTAAELDGGVAAKEATGDGGGKEQRLVLQLAAANFVASVSDQPDWPENDAGAKRLGYLRNGAVVDAYDPPVKNDECKEGWYELVTGGYVCGKHATIDLTNPRVRLAPKQPDRDAGMPYRYGINVSDGTPLYRRVLNSDDRQKYEHPTKAKSDDLKDSKESATSAEDKPAPAADTEPTLTGDAPAAPTEDNPPLSQEDDPPPQRKHTRDKHHSKKKNEKTEKPIKDPFKDKAKGERPSLSDLKGRGVLVRKLARGFTIALDRDFKGAGTRWWRTTFGFAVPFDKVAIQSPQTKYIGNWYTSTEPALEALRQPYPNLGELDSNAQVVTPDAGVSLAGTVGFIMYGGASKLEIKDDEKGNPKVGWVSGEQLPKRSSVLLTGNTKTVNGMTYYEISDGSYVMLASLKIAHPQIPGDVKENEKWIDVDLTRQMLVAYEGRKPVFGTLISSGRKNPDDPEHNYATPPGNYRIREKHITATMDADTAADGPYSIEDVPWVMYFQGSYALHGAFWHDSFGNMRSHGCVNMSPDDARALFSWSDPPLPAGWHGVFSKDDNTGSRVIVHEDAPPGKHH